MTEWLRTDKERAAAGAAAGIAGAVAVVAVAPPVPVLLAVPGAIAFVAVGAVVGAEVVLAFGDWWDRR